VPTGKTDESTANTRFVPETNAGIELAFLELFSSDGVVVVVVGVVVGGGEVGVWTEAVVVSGEGASTGGKSTNSTPASFCGAGGLGSAGCVKGGVDGAGEGGGNADGCGGAGDPGIQPSWRATPSKSARRSSGDAGAICGLAAPSDPSGTILTNVSRLRSGGAV